jgi:hypothetical protein
VTDFFIVMLNVSVLKADMLNMFCKLAVFQSLQQSFMTGIALSKAEP